MCLGIPGEVLELRQEGGMSFGKVRFGGITRDVCMQCLPEAGVGDYVLVHVGFAISRIDPAQARNTLQALEELGLMDELQPEKETGDTP